MMSWYVFIIYRGASPPGPPYTLARGGPTIPAPLAWLTSLRSFALTGGFAPRTRRSTSEPLAYTVPRPVAKGPGEAHMRAARAG